MKKLIVMSILSIVGTNALALCTGYGHEYQQCKQLEAINEQTEVMRQMQQQQQLQYQQSQYPQFLQDPFKRQKQCFRDYFGNVQCY